MLVDTAHLDPDPDLRVRELPPTPDIAVYKVLPGLRPSLRQFNASCCCEQATTDSGGVISATPAAPAATTATGLVDDWRALYTQFRRDHALGTVPYKWEQGCSYCTLVEVRFRQPLRVLVLEGELMHREDVSGEAKAAAVRAKLAEKVGEVVGGLPLMERLGSLGYVALVRETACEWELVIPHALLGSLAFSERFVARFERDVTMPVTRRWGLCWGGEEDLFQRRSSGGSWAEGDDSDLAGSLAWQDWRESRGSRLELAEGVPDLDVRWAEEVMRMS